MKKKLLLGVMLALFLVLGLSQAAWATDTTPTAEPKPQYQNGLVYLVPIKGDIGPGLTNFVQASVFDAESQAAGLIIFEIDTYGGYIDDAIQIKKLIMETELPTLAYIHDKALSAGSLIALSCDYVVMAPGSTMGAAEPRLGDTKADPKVVSMWSKELAAAAESNGRDGKIAMAMADSDIEIEGLNEKGKLLTLTAEQATEQGMADSVVKNRQEVLSFAGAADAPVHEAEVAFQDKVGGWLADPIVITILLILGLVGILLEIIHGGFGLFGTVGVLAFALYFTGSFLAGSVGWLGIFLFIIGLVLIALEIFVIPGFGVVGVGGIVAVFASIILAAQSVEMAIISLLIALGISIVVIILSLKLLKTRRGIWSKLILFDKQETTEGFISSKDFDQYQDAIGLTITPLRPAGSIELADGTRLDVVTEGIFVELNKKVRVLETKGRIVVRPVNEAE